MNVVLAAGISLTTAGVAGYLVGLAVAYPGRAFSVTGVMIGITLVAIGRSSGSAGGGDEASRSERESDDISGGEPT